MASVYQEHRKLEKRFKSECIEAGRECLTARDAARLFGMNEVALRVAKHDKRLVPVFALAYRDLPLFRLADVRAYLSREPDEKLLATMRSHGLTCSVHGAGGWLLLSERPGLRKWEDVAHD